MQHTEPEAQPASLRMAYEPSVTAAAANHLFSNLRIPRGRLQLDIGSPADTQNRCLAATRAYVRHGMNKDGQRSLNRPTLPYYLRDADVRKANWVTSVQDACDAVSRLIPPTRCG